MSTEELQKSTSILIADDHQLLIDSVAQMLKAELDFEVRTAHDLAGTLDELAGRPADLVLLDVKMPGMNGMESVSEVIRANHGAAVALFSGNIDETFARMALREGSAGFIPKTISMRLLSAAIRLICSGGVYMPVSTAPADGPGHDAAHPLSERDVRIVQMIQAGKTNKEIARVLATTEVRVKMYIRAIFTKLGARNRAHAVTILRAKNGL